MRWEIPDGYEGWVRAYYDDPAAPSLNVDGITVVWRVDSNGCGYTSSGPLDGLRNQSYVYVGADGQRVEVPQTMIQSATSGAIGTVSQLDASGSVIRAGKNFHMDQFFVGTQDSFRNNTDHQANIEQRCPMPS